jgi:DNA alkylation repair enzyme
VKATARRAPGSHTREPRLHTIRSVDTARVALEIEGGVRSAGDAARAEHERRYLKSDLDHFGASVPSIRRIAKGRWPTIRRFAATTWCASSLRSGRRPVHECRMAAVGLLHLGSGLLRADDMALIERLIRESKTWALVDGLDASVAGPLV